MTGRPPESLLWKAVNVSVSRVCNRLRSSANLLIDVTHGTEIYLALSDDWELRGNSSGDVSQLQFTPWRG